MEEKFCSICFDNENLKSEITLECNHIFHFDCINEWYKKGNNKYMEKILTCPYCRAIAIITKIPKNYDCFFKFYYFTHFKRGMCIHENCSNKEFPLNAGICSKHFYPKINKYDLDKIMNYIFPFFFMTLPVKKFILSFCIQLHEKNMDMDIYLPVFLDNLKKKSYELEYLHQFSPEYSFDEILIKFPELENIRIQVFDSVFACF